MPPPPPPPGPPLPPPPPAGPLGGGTRGGGASNDKGQLLAEIRKGTGLKKVTTNDRSAPIIDGKKQNANGSGEATRSNGAPQGLGGLFAGGMPKLKSTVPGRPGIQPLKPPGRIVNDAVENKSKSPSPQPKLTTHSEVPAGYGTMRRPFPNDVKPQAPQPPAAGQIFNKPSVPDVTNNNVNRLKPSPPLPSKPHSFNAPKIQMQQGGTKRGYPVVKPPPPPKSPGTNVNVPPALPSKPPSLHRHQSMNENDWRHRRSIVSGGSPVMVVAKNTPPVMTVTSASSMTAIPTAVNNTMDNNNRMGAPPPYGQHTRNGSTTNVSMYGKQNHAPPPPPSRNTPYAPRPPPPPPPSRVGTQQVQQAQSAPPPPPPPHRTGPPPPPPGQPNKQAALPGQGGQATGQALPPPPPARNFSTRNSASGGDDFESRFAHLFHSENDIPQPGQFIGHKKFYPSESAKNGQGQRNPPPPPPPTTMKNDNTHYQLGQKMFAHEATKC